MSERVARGRYDGALNVVRFNWPFFALALVAVLVVSGAALASANPTWQRVCALGVIGGVTGMLLTLGVSHLIYDRSDLYRYAWMERAIRGMRMQRAIFCQTGFDESSAALRTRFATTAWTLLDHYDPTFMTEPSIQRARRRCPPAPETQAAPFDAWPTPDATADVVVGMLSVHELPHEHERAQWFAEARRAICADGRVIVVEHTRDLANALVFGPGALHFHAPSSWRRSWERAALRLREEFRITPWVRVFVLEPA